MAISIAPKCKYQVTSDLANKAIDEVLSLANNIKNRHVTS